MRYFCFLCTEVFCLINAAQLKELKGVNFPGSNNPRFCRFVWERSRHYLKPVRNFAFPAAFSDISIFFFFLYSLSICFSDKYFFCIWEWILLYFPSLIVSCRFYWYCVFMVMSILEITFCLLLSFSFSLYFSVLQASLSVLSGLCLLVLCVFIFCLSFQLRNVFGFASYFYISLPFFIVASNIQMECVFLCYVSIITFLVCPIPINTYMYVL